MATADSGRTFDPQANPPQGKLLRLSSANPQFLNIWEETLPDSPYESARDYDLALASMAMAAQDRWTDQEICDLIIAKRRARGQSLMPEREYYDGIIASARRPLERDQAEEDLKILLYCRNGETTDEERARILDLLHRVLGVRIYGITRFIGDPPIFWMSTDGGDVTIGRVDHLTSQTDFSNLVLGATGVVMTPRNREQWRMIVQALMRAAINDDVGDASYPLVEMREWIHAYLVSRKPLPKCHLNVFIAHHPFMHEEQAHIFLQKFTSWLRTRTQGPLIAGDLARRLKILGGQPKELPFTLNGRTTKRSVWRLPDEFADRIRQFLPTDNHS